MFYAKTDSDTKLHIFSSKAERDVFVSENTTISAEAIDANEARRIASFENLAVCHGKCQPPRSWNGKSAGSVCWYRSFDPEYLTSEEGETASEWYRYLPSVLS